MTIEEKAEAYDEAYARMSKAYNDNKCTIGFMNEIFPKLKENKEIEGEKIRKWLIALIKSNEYGSISNVGKMPCPKLNVLAWLEKQGNLMKALQISNARIGELIEENYYLKEQVEKQGESMEINPTEFNSLPKEILTGNLSFLSNVIQNDGTYKDKEKQEEQKSVTMSLDEAIEHCKEKSYNNNACALEHKQLEKWLTELKELKEQNLAWSEEDENRFKNLIMLVNCSNENEPTKKGFIDFINRLKSLKNRVQPQVEWSEEDKEYLAAFINVIDNFYILSGELKKLTKIDVFRGEYAEKLKSWLNSLKDRVQLKQKWNEEDNRIRKAIIDNIKAICKEGYFVGNIGSDELIDWLKNRVQPQPKQEWNKQQVVNALTAMLTEKIKSLTEKVSDNTINDREEMFRAALIEIRSFVNSPSFQIGKDVSVVWSEEDEQYLLVCKNALAKYQTTDKWDANIIFHWLENKIKSLRPQKWKPTEEQIMCLQDAIDDYHRRGYKAETLETLLKQLKQL